MESILTKNWAKADARGALVIDGGEREIKMQNSDATGSPLFSYNGFGADVIRFSKGGKVGRHVHVGDHILFVLKGKGKVEFKGILYDLFPGLSYLIPGSVSHAIYAEEELVLIAVGNNHQPLDSAERLKLV